VTESLLELHARALILSRVPALAELDVDTLLAIADEADEVVFPAGASIGDPGAAYILSDRVVPPGDTLVAASETRALRLEADRWLDVVEELAAP